MELCIIPPKMTVEGNSTFGDCVTAEEAAAKAAYSILCGLAELYVPDDVTVAWARKYGFLDGADLTEVMDQMAKDGLTVGGVNYKDGPYEAVNYSSEANIQSACAQGPVKIGIDADALSPDAGNGNGWFSMGGSPASYRTEDHCVAIFGYCKAATLYGALGRAVPAEINPDKVGYILYTWGTVGFVDHDWIMSTCGEAWVRTPTTVGQSPVPTPAPPVPPVPPVPPAPQTARVAPVSAPVTGSVRIGWLGSFPIDSGVAAVPGQSAPIGAAGPKLGFDLGQLMTDLERFAADARPIVAEAEQAIADFKAGNWAAEAADVASIVGSVSSLVPDIQAIRADIGI